MADKMRDPEKMSNAELLGQLSLQRMTTDNLQMEITRRANICNLHGDILVDGVAVEVKIVASSILKLYGTRELSYCPWCIANEWLINDIENDVIAGAINGDNHTIIEQIVASILLDGVNEALPEHVVEFIRNTGMNPTYDTPETFTMEVTRG